MNISTLCDKINLQSEVKSRVLAFADGFDFTTADKLLKGFLTYQKMAQMLTELQAILGEDKNNIKILACTLKASADAYAVYQAKGISDEIYFDTMKCYPRFIDETYQMTGRLYFDRYWWTTRQAGCHLYRIGELEYEMKHTHNTVVIGIHIPSDADFSPMAVEHSLMCSRKFFAKYYPELSNAEYRCHSWLMDRQLREMLGENSNILYFQNRFEIFNEGEISTEFIEWIYHTKSTEYATFSETTSLQRNIKKQLLSGGVIRNAYGKLKQ